MRRLSSLVLFLVLAACADEADAPSVGERAKTASSSRAPEPASPADEEEAPGAMPTPQSDQPKASKGGGGSGRAGRGGVKLATVTGLQGSLTQQQVEQTIASAKSPLLACYGNAEARVEVSLQIGASGEVGDVAVRRSTPDQPKQKECAQLVLGKLRFPPPTASLKLDLAIVLDPEG